MFRSLRSTRRPFRATLPTLFVVVSAVASAVACSDSRSNDAASPATPATYDIPLLSEAELAKEIDALCEEATTPALRPVLVEFSAAWCSDCRKLAEMKGAESLAKELARWPRLEVNVERFDRHRALLDALAVDSIAHWAILAPTDCARPITEWPRVADRTLEVSSGAARHLTPADLAQWLAGFRS